MQSPAEDMREAKEAAWKGRPAEGCGGRGREGKVTLGTADHL